MTWRNDIDYLVMKRPPACWPCHHYERRLTTEASEHRCHIARPEFPRGGVYCRAYRYEPGADAKEFNTEPQ